VEPFRKANQIKRCPFIDLNIHRIRLPEGWRIRDGHDHGGNRM